MFEESKEEIVDQREIFKMLQNLSYHVHISEVHNPSRFIEESLKMQLRYGDALDRSQSNPEGTLWDFARESDKELRKATLKERRPLLLIGSLMCPVFSKLMHLNEDKVSKEEWG